MQLPKLSEAQKQQLRKEVEAEIYTRSLYEFFVAASKILYPQVEWQYPPFYRYICDLLQEAVERNIGKEEKTHDYIFNLPFRAGKSILLSQIFPVWCWIKQPSLAIMQVSHSETLAIKHSHASKMLIESEWFLSPFVLIGMPLCNLHTKCNPNQQVSALYGMQIQSHRRLRLMLIIVNQQTYPKISTSPLGIVI